MKTKDTTVSDQLHIDGDWPSVSFTIATYNSDRTLEQALVSVRDQDYPGKMEIVIADGGSTDTTCAIAKKYDARVITVPKDVQNAEYNKGVAANNAKHELLVMIDHDNILPHRQWLKKMVYPLVENPHIIGVGVQRFLYDRSMTTLDRYFALIGANDPVAFFFNKSAHQSYLYNLFHLRGALITERPDYYLIVLDPERMPALGGNGSVLRRALLKEAQAAPENFFHIDIHVDLAKKGYVTYAFVKDAIIHLTNNKVWPFLNRRRYFIEKYHFEDQRRRRYSVYEPKKDKLRLMGYIVYSATVIGPFIDAVRGFLMIRDSAWFLHPVMCFSMLVMYGYPTIKLELRRVLLAR